MKIRIVRGMYGHQENGRVVEKNNGSAPFEVSGQEGERLVAEGIAVRADEEGMAGTEERCAAGIPGDGGDAVGNGGSVAQETREQMLNLGMEELRRIAGELGLKKNGSREDIVNRILQEKESEEESDIPEMLPADPE